MDYPKQEKKLDKEGSKSKPTQELKVNSENGNRKDVNKCMSTTFQIDGLSYTIGKYTSFFFNFAILFLE